ncbi:MAG: MBL fold metallo-hydrolase [Planctomycetes bacterium]|nr:MBL fold metallo-hydrolase [Planctomycetota bacterium]MBI3844978.1 MBL fold metallo-hydrolase [Planctomycetota bacterium]
MAIKVLVETVGPFSENSYFLVDEETREAVAVDPGDEAPRLLAVVRRHDLTVRWILNTHGHLDHVGAVAELKEATRAPFHIHKADLFLVEAIPEQAALFGLRPPPIPRIDGYLEEGDVFTFGKGPVRIEVIETPGHTPGGVTFRVGDDLFVGDALFAGSIGRTDLPGGDTETLLRSIRERLLAFPDGARVYSGHGPATTIGRERRTNPFLQD